MLALIGKGIVYALPYLPVYKTLQSYCFSVNYASKTGKMLHQRKIQITEMLHQRKFQIDKMLLLREFQHKQQ